MYYARIAEDFADDGKIWVSPDGYHKEPCELGMEELITALVRCRQDGHYPTITTGYFRM